MPGPAIQFRQVGLALGGVEILRDIDFSVAAGEIHCLIGPNGGGKTSLARCLLGQMPHTGSVAIDGEEPITIGYVPQSLDFDKTLPVTVDDLMAMVCQNRRPAFFGMGRNATERAASALDRVGFSPEARRTKLGSLSGGERQRVLLAQALVPEPDLLILDEPMTSMDEVGIERFLNLIRSVAADGTTVVWIAHELGQVRALADTATCISRTVLFSGTPKAVLGELPAETLFKAREVS